MLIGVAEINSPNGKTREYVVFFAETFYSVYTILRYGSQRHSLLVSE